MAAAITRVTAVAMSFDETGFDLGEVGRLSEDILAGKEADGVDPEGGGGGEGKAGKNGWPSGGDEVAVVGLGVNGTSDADDDGGTPGESCGKNGWCSVRRLWTAVASMPDFVHVSMKRKGKTKKKMGIFMDRLIE